MILLKQSVHRIIEDFRHKELLPLKLIFFIHASTVSVLYPYLTIHMRQLGINVEETAILSAVLPIVAIVLPSLAGMLADRIGNFKVLLSFISSLGGAAALLLLLVPVSRVTVKFPQRVVMDLSCPGTESEIIYTMSQHHPCVSKSQPKISTRIESCGYVCQIDVQNVTEQNSLLSSTSYNVTYHDLETNSNITYEYNSSKNENLVGKISANDDIRENRQMRNNDDYDNSVRRLSRSLYYFPTTDLYDFRCTEKPIVADFTENSTTTETTLRSNEIFCDFVESTYEIGVNRTSIVRNDEMAKLKSIESNYIDRLEKKRRFLVERLNRDNSENFFGARCKNPEIDGRKISVVVSLVNRTMDSKPYKYLNLDGCGKRCVVTGSRLDICENMNTVVEYDPKFTFWIYFVIRIMFGSISVMAFGMFEGAVFAILRERKADYGLQRIYGTLGGMISSPLAGMLIDYSSRNKAYTDFRPAVYLYATLKISSGILMLLINLEFKTPASNVVGDVFSVLKNVEVIGLFLACLVLGTCWGYIESFLFWFLQDLGGTGSLMGITITVGGIAGIPLLVLSGPIIDKFGHANVLFVGFVFYTIRLLGYSLIYNPWHCLIFEALESVTISLSFTAAATYAAKLSTATTDTTIQALLVSLYFGVGKGSGSLIGGYLMKGFGTRPTYRIFAVVSLVVGIIYFIFNLTYMKKRSQVETNDVAKNNAKETTNARQNGVEQNVNDITGANEMKKVEANNAGGIENFAFVGNTDDIEAMRNARNRNSIDDSSDVEGPKNSKNKNVEKATTNIGNKVEDFSECAVIPTESMVGKCKVVVEKQPNDDKSHL